MKTRSAALLAAVGVLALAGCQDQQATQGGDAAPPTSQTSRAAAQPSAAASSTGQAPSSTAPAPVVTRSTTEPRIAWTKEDLAKQLRADRKIPDSTTVTCVEGLPAKEGRTTTCTAAKEDGSAELYAAVVKPAGVTGAMAPKFVKVSRNQ